MAFSLIDDDAGAVPLVAVSKAGLAAWREAAPARERDWVAATGFAGEAGKLALVPDKKGGLGRVLVGMPEGEAAMWAFAGLSDALPEGSYRIEALPEGGDPTRSALGWALGTYAFTRYRAPKKASGARLVWPDGADRAVVEHLAGAVFLARDLVNTPASDMGPAELADAAVAVAEKAGARHRVILGDALLAENYPTIHAVGRASVRAPRLVDIVWGEEIGAEGDAGRQGGVLRFGRARPQGRLGHAQHEKGHGRRGDHARARPGDHGGEAAGAPARAVADGRECGLRQCDAAARHRQDEEGADRRDRQHRRRGPPHPVRRARRSLDRKAGAARRHRHPDRRRAGRARPRIAGPLLQ